VSSCEGHVPPHVCAGSVFENHVINPASLKNHVISPASLKRRALGQAAYLKGQGSVFERSPKNFIHLRNTLPKGISAYLKTMGAYLKSRKVRLAYLKTMGAYFKVQNAKNGQNVNHFSAFCL